MNPTPYTILNPNSICSGPGTAEESDVKLAEEDYPKALRNHLRFRVLGGAGLLRCKV